MLSCYQLIRVALDLWDLYNPRASSYPLLDMLLHSLGILFSDPILFILLVLTFFATGGVALLLAITVHEFSHALVAHNLGDITPKHLGRLSLNPIRHLDPLGTVMIFAVGFGWGKPVPVNPFYLRIGPRTGMSVVAAAGPISNIITAVVCSIPIRIGLLPWHSPSLRVGFYGLEGFMADLFGWIVFFNIILAVFNLIPLFPLDGSKIAIGVLPSSIADKVSRLESLGPVVLLLLIMVDSVTGLNILWGVLGPLANVVGLLVVGSSF